MQNIRKFIISLTFIAALGFITQSCFDGLNDFTYKGDPVVEFSTLTHDAASWTSVGSYWSASLEVWHQDDIDLTVALVGPHGAQDRTIGFYVADQLYRDTDANRLTTEQPDHDEWVLMESTGQAGIDYTLGANVATIPANSSFGDIPVDLTPADVNDIFIVLEEGDLAPSENYKFFRLTTIPVFQLAMDLDPAEAGEVQGAALYPEGTEVSIEAISEDRFEFTEWTGDTDHVDDVNSAETTVDMPAADISLTANFVPAYELALEADPEEGGTVEGAGFYSEGTEVDIEAVTEYGWEFDGWTGDIGYLTDPASAEATITMSDEDINLTANFLELNLFEVTLQVNEEGWGTVEGSGNYVEGDEITISAISAEGYTFVEWTGDITNVADAGSATTTLEVPAADVTITAVFEADDE